MLVVSLVMAAMIALGVVSLLGLLRQEAARLSAARAMAAPERAPAPPEPGP